MKKNVISEVPSHHAQSCSHGVEEFPVQVLLDYLRSMFESDAILNGIELSCVNCSLTIRANPILLFRMLVNEIESAIYNTSRGKILMDCRRGGRCVKIQILTSGQRTQVGGQPIFRVSVPCEH